MFGDIIQPTHLLFILVIALLVLGPKRLPEVGRSLGRGIRDFRQGMQGVEAEARGVFGGALEEPDTTQTVMPQTATPEAATTQTMQAQPMETPATAGPVAAGKTSPSPAPVATRATAEPDPADYAD